MRPFRFSPALPQTPAFTIGDGLILLGFATLLYAGRNRLERRRHATSSYLVNPDNGSVKHFRSASLFD
jgi:hypothetical protein